MKTPTQTWNKMDTTKWTRIEPQTRNEEMPTGLQARVYDPLWLLCRQWQTGEFLAEDAGSPVSARIRIEEAPISRFYPGRLDGQNSYTGFPYDGERTPLETLIERTPVRNKSNTSKNYRIAAEAGMHFLRMLEKKGLKKYHQNYLSEYPIILPVDEQQACLDESSKKFLAITARRSLDGQKLYEDFKRTFPELPANPVIDSEDLPFLLEVSQRWMQWYETFFDEPQNEPTSWISERMEYAFALSADTSSGEKVLKVEEHHGGHLDWYAFDHCPDCSLNTQEQTSRELRKNIQTFIPTPVSFQGMPASRWWEFEDAEVDFGQIEAEPTDLISLVFLDFVLTYGNDWFLVPLDMTPGAIHKVNSLVVMDSFGLQTIILPYQQIDGHNAHWRMFCPGIDRHFSTNQEESPEEMFFLPPVISNSLHSKPLEEVHFIRDEMANLAWAVERKVENAIGKSIDRHEYYQETRQKAKEKGTDPNLSSPNSTLVYHMATDVPDHWIPMVPIRVPSQSTGGNSGLGTIRLRRGQMFRQGVENTSPTGPLGEILDPGKKLILFEEEIPRAGIKVSRIFQYTRWIDGSSHLWMGRRKSTGRGEGWSGLRFDIIEEK